MKFRTTKKEIINNYSKIIKVGYCSAQTLLHFQDPIAYTAGAYGWNCDIYVIDNVVISTGYNPFGNIQPKYDRLREYEKSAEALLSWECQLTWEEKRDRVNELLKEFIRESTTTKRA